MKVNIYSCFDNLAGCAVMVFTAKNNELCKRLVRSALMTKEPNPFNTDCKDKQVFLCGSIDQETNEVESVAKPVLVFGVEDVRQDLINYIAAETGKSGEEIAKHVGRNEQDIPDDPIKPIE